MAPPQLGEEDGDRGGRHEREHAGGIRPRLLVDVGAEGERHDGGDERQDEHERPRRAGPVRRHAVAGQVAGHDVEQPAMAEAPANHRMPIVEMS